MLDPNPNRRLVGFRRKALPWKLLSESTLDDKINPTVEPVYEGDPGWEQVERLNKLSHDANAVLHDRPEG